MLYLVLDVTESAYETDQQYGTRIIDASHPVLQMETFNLYKSRIGLWSNDRKNCVNVFWRETLHLCSCERYRALHLVD